jgi:hypothetical protein
MQLGMEGYGIYWYLIESLAESGGTLPLQLIPVLAMQMHTTEAKVNAVVNAFSLFEITEILAFASACFTLMTSNKIELKNG